MSGIYSRNLWVGLSVIIMMCVLVTEGAADTIEASSVSRSTVAEAISRATSGDTVSIPAGRATWSSNISIPDSKRITVRGAGATETVIVGGGAFSLGTSGSRITRIGFESNDRDFISVAGKGWRIDHCTFTNTGSSSCLGVYASSQSSEPPPAGVVDHCTFNFTRVIVYGSRDLMGSHIWAEPLGLGTDNAVFIEDCTFRWNGFGNCVDSQYAGRYVFRYNTVIDTVCEVHSTSNPSSRTAGRSWEIYENTFEAVNETPWYPFRIRGGTGVVFNNTITGRYENQHIAFDNVRSCDGRCDGTSPMDGNQRGEAGYPCRDQIGRSTDAFEYQEDGNWPSQELDPAYAWGNVNDTGTAEFVTIRCQESQNHIQEGRDFYNGTPKPGYTPYAYPHPRVTADDGDVEPPTGEEVEPPSRLRLE